MMSAIELVLPLTDTGRKYGYIIWPKGRDTEVRQVLAQADEVILILPGGAQKKARVDWKHHRVSVGYSVTRALPAETRRVTLSLESSGSTRVLFA
jgi:hypothetical protein